MKPLKRREVKAAIKKLKYSAKLDDRAMRKNLKQLLARMDVDPLIGS